MLWHQLLGLSPWRKKLLPLLQFIHFWPCRTACCILVPPPRTEPTPPASEAWGFNQWTTKGAPMFSILDFTWFRPFILEMRKGLAQDHSPTWLIRPGLLITHLVEQKLFPLQHPQMIPKISFWSPGRVSQECSTNFFVKAPYQMKDNCRKLSPSAGNMP